MTINPSGKLIYPEKLSTLDAERAYDAESGRNVILVAAEADRANEAVVVNDEVTARDAETAQLPVPSNDPVIPLYTDSVSNLYINNLIINVFHINIILWWKSLDYRLLLNYLTQTAIQFLILR